MQFFYEGKMEKYNFSVVKAFAEYVKVPEKIAEQTLQSMTLSDYAGFVSALDIENEKEILRIVDKYMTVDDQTVIEESIKSYNSKQILSKVAIMEERSRLSLLPRVYANAFENVKYLSEDQMKEYLGIWLVNEDIDPRQIRDIAAIKYVYENTINPQLRNNIARLANKSSTMVKNPTYVDPKKNTTNKIVSADPQKNVIATQDDKGEIEVVQLDPQSKKQIALEELQKLAGIK